MLAALGIAGGLLAGCAVEPSPEPSSLAEGASTNQAAVDELLTSAGLTLTDQARVKADASVFTISRQGQQFRVEAALWEAELGAAHVAEHLDVREFQDGGGASVAIGTWDLGVVGASISCPEHVLLLTADRVGEPALQAVSVAAARLALAWRCNGVDG